MPNDPVINNVAGMVMQILHEAQGVRDISGAVLGDYETISPEAGASVQIVNAESGVPFKKLVNILPRQAQDGSGTPAPDNVRKIPTYDKAIIRNGNAEPFEVKLENFYAGEVDFVAKRVKSTIIRVKIPADVEWVLSAEGSFSYFIANNTNLPIWIKTTGGRWAVGENCMVNFVSGSTQLLEGCFGLYTAGGSTSNRIYYRLGASQDFENADAFKAWLAENEFYIYYALQTPEISPVETTILYVLMPEYTISADYGTLTIEYSGIAPEETNNAPGDGLASVPERISRPEIPAIVEPETPAIVEPIAEEIKNQEDEEK